MNSHDLSPKDASRHTSERNRSVEFELDPADFERARRGFIASHPTGQIADDNGRRVSDISAYAFLQTEPLTQCIQLCGVMLSSMPIMAYSK